MSSHSQIDRTTKARLLVRLPASAIELLILSIELVIDRIGNRCAVHLALHRSHTLALSVALEENAVVVVGVACPALAARAL